MSEWLDEGLKERVWLNIKMVCCVQYVRLSGTRIAQLTPVRLSFNIPTKAKPFKQEKPIEFILGIFTLSYWEVSIAIKSDFFCSFFQKLFQFKAA